MPYIYLVHCRASVNAGEPVYKIGKSVDFNKRLSGYDKGTVPLLSLFVKECDNFERHLIALFRSMFNARTDYGSEYFEGDVQNMIRCIVEEHARQSLTYAIETETSDMPTVVAKEMSPVDIIKTKKLLFKKLNTLHRSKMKKLYEFRDHLVMQCNVVKFDRTPLYGQLTNILMDYGSNPLHDRKGCPITEEKNKNNFGDYCESRCGLITTISMTHDTATFQLIEAIKNAL